MEMAILTDVTKCIGCEQCVTACKTENNTGKDSSRRWLHRFNDLSSTRLTTILRKEGRYVRQQCRHCLEPACVSVCPVGALQKTSEGPVVYDPDICMGCRYCMMACPFGIPRYQWEKSVPLITKCTMCYQKISDGDLTQPACTEACPTQATIFGDRKNLLKIARDRLKKHPDNYIQKIYGEKEVGGTSVLYISDVDLNFLALNDNLGEEGLPHKTAWALNAVPPVFVGVGALMYGTYRMFERRKKVAEAAKKEQSKSDTQS